MVVVGRSGVRVQVVDHGGGTGRGGVDVFVAFVDGFIVYLWSYDEAGGGSP